MADNESFRDILEEIASMPSFEEYNRELRPAPCSFCHEYKPRKVMRLIPLMDGFFCPDCFDSALEQLVDTCEICGAQFRRRQYEIHHLCLPCRSATRYVNHVNAQLRRTKELGLLSTLTIAQWKFAIEYFNGLCAYCQKKQWSAIEHFIPVCNGGGTTSENCIPACTACNGKKLGKPARTVFSAQQIERILTFFEVVKSR